MGALKCGVKRDRWSIFCTKGWVDSDLARYQMEARLTEFSYGYCVTEELSNGTGPGFKAAPYFPSLFVEGKTGGGFDVQIGTALFLQFKLSEELTRRSAKETQLKLLEPTFFRFWLHRRDRSRQHLLLSELESVAGNSVYYIAPEFADVNALDAAYNSTDGVVGRSAMFSPIEIGPLEDDKYHSVAFKPGEVSGWFLSEPKSVRVHRRADVERIIKSGPSSEGTSGFRDWIGELASAMKTIIQQTKKRSPVGSLS